MIASASRFLTFACDGQRTTRRELLSFSDSGGNLSRKTAAKRTLKHPGSWNQNKPPNDSIRRVLNKIFLFYRFTWTGTKVRLQSCAPWTGARTYNTPRRALVLTPGIKCANWLRVLQHAHQRPCTWIHRHTHKPQQSP